MQIKGAFINFVGVVPTNTVTGFYQLEKVSFQYGVFPP